MTYIVEHIEDQLAAAFEAKMADHLVVRRLLRPGDRSLSVGVVCQNWQHVPEAAQIGQREPAWGRYTVRIQNMVKHADEQTGRRTHSVQCALLRAVLYRDDDLQLGLIGVEEQILGSVERTKRLVVRRQDFLNQQVSGIWTYVCATEMYVETEITRQ